MQKKCGFDLKIDFFFQINQIKNNKILKRLKIKSKSNQFKTRAVMIAGSRPRSVFRDCDSDHAEFKKTPPGWPDKNLTIKFTIN